MFPEIEKRCEEILSKAGNDPLEIAKLAYITALIDAGIITPNAQGPG